MTELVNTNITLKSMPELKAHLDLAKHLGLPIHPDPRKNWDNLKASLLFASRFESTSRILDAGADKEPTSVFLPTMRQLLGCELFGMNLNYEREQETIDQISYVRGDITKTPFSDAYFNGIASLSVIEHGVDINAYFREVSRLLQPGGLLLTSTDYWPNKIYNEEQVEAYGQPVFIFSQPEIMHALSLAAQYDLYPTSEIDFIAEDQTIDWLGFEYTFIVFTLQKC